MRGRGRREGETCGYDGDGVNLIVRPQVTRCKYLGSVNIEIGPNDYRRENSNIGHGGLRI